MFLFLLAFVDFHWNLADWHQLYMRLDYYSQEHQNSKQQEGLMYIYSWLTHFVNKRHTVFTNDAEILLFRILFDLYVVWEIMTF